jgi:hypothetical protein
MNMLLPLLALSHTDTQPDKHTYVLSHSGPYTDKRTPILRGSFKYFKYKKLGGGGHNLL